MARRIKPGGPTTKRAANGYIKVSMTLKAELAWRLDVKAAMMRKGLGEMCSGALQTLVEDDSLPWHRYRQYALRAPSDSLQTPNGETGENPAVETLPISEDSPPPAPKPARGGGQKGGYSPATQAAIDRGRGRKAS